MTLTELQNMSSDLNDSLTEIDDKIAELVNAKHEIEDAIEQITEAVAAIEALDGFSLSVSVDLEFQIDF